MLGVIGIRLMLLNQVVHSLLCSKLLYVLLGGIAPPERGGAPHNPVNLLGGGLITQEFPCVEGAHEGLIMGGED